MQELRYGSCLALLVAGLGTAPPILIGCWLLPASCSLGSRGADRAEIYSICFSPNSQLLACSSDKGTVHVFALTTEGSGTTGTFSNEHSSIAPASPAIPTPHYVNTNSGPPRSSVEDESTENSKSR